MKKKYGISFKLTLFFSAALLLFSVSIGVVFLLFLRTHSIELYRQDMQKRAETIAGTISGFIGNTSPGMGMGGRQGGYGAYLRFLNEMAMTDVWIVDENLNLITPAMGNHQYSYTDLPPNADAVVKQVFQGSTTFSESFSNLLSTPSLTVGTPIIYNKNVVGALLMHSPIEGMNVAIRKGFRILLFSIPIALVLSVLLSVFLALAFTKPLKRMKNSTLRLAGGDYTVKTSVVQKDEIGELASAIDVLSEKLLLASQEHEKLEKLRQDFISNISHELRTPVTVIRGSLEALCDEVVTDVRQVQDYHFQMLQESRFLERLVNDLLDLSRLANMDFQMDMEQVNLADILGDSVRSATQMARGKNVDIQYEKALPVNRITGDYGRLRQMFLVILNNAVKFSRPDSVVSVTMDENEVIIRDTGIGISREDLPHIFERFYRVKSEENKEGTGLGLAIAKKIADRHNIGIFVKSTINQGTEFRFELRNPDMPHMST
jgi:signal transduction histidine kinase